VIELLNQIPHEFGDFAILLRSGLTRSRAALLQAITAFAGIYWNSLCRLVVIFSMAEFQLIARSADKFVFRSFRRAVCHLSQRHFARSGAQVHCAFYNWRVYLCFAHECAS
jgi:zinc transporter ZupT